ncbi:integrase [Pseudomonas sp. MC042]|uniref:Integrase n=1 Tax=Pseudomonas piscis TaxID=2614538 RepID=A0A7X1PJP6_9PSED|nr:integrase [Pseudomonas piscis]
MRSAAAACSSPGGKGSHYSTPELQQLIEAATKVSATDSRGPALTILRRKTG